VDRKWWTLVAVCAGVFMLLLDITIVNVALPDIQIAFKASLSDLQWVIDAYALSLAAFLLTAGSVADLLGRRRVFAVGITVFTLGSLLCGFATGVRMLSLARAAQGIGGAIMFATALALIAQAFRGRDRGVAFGFFGAITGVAIAVGPVLGGAITSGWSWRWIFFVNVPIGLLTLFVTLTRVDESRDPAARRPDWLGFVTFSTALVALVYGLIRSTADGWSSTTVVASLVTAAVLLAAFVAVEQLQQRPMFDFALLRVPTFSGGLVAALGISAGLFALITYLVLYMQSILGLSPVQSGVRFLPMTGAIFVTAGIAGRLTGRLPTRLLIAPGFVLITAGLLLMRGLTPGSGWTHLLPGMVLAGVGAGLVNVPLASTAVGVVEPARAGMASGINSTFRQVGIATGVALLGTIFAAHLSSTVATHLSRTALADRATQLGDSVSTGHLPGALASTPPELRGSLAEAARAGFVNGLNLILLVSALVTFAAAVLSFVLIRQRDFVVAEPDREPATAAAAG
jgi:EmrB/QacA subfamily drug resistance transporter